MLNIKFADCYVAVSNCGNLHLENKTLEKISTCKTTYKYCWCVDCEVINTIIQSSIAQWNVDIQIFKIRIEQNI